MAKGIVQHLRGNVVGYLALFVALGGTALALDRNEVRSRHIAPGAVKRSDTSDKLRLKCPGGTRYHEGACIETSLRGMAIWSVAGADCYNDNRRLPDIAELESFRFEPGITVGNTGEGPEDEWTGDLFLGSEPNDFYARDVSEGNTTGSGQINSSQVYRCVAPPKR